MAQTFYPQLTGNHALDNSLRIAFDYIYQLRASQPVVTPATATTPAKITATSGGTTTVVNITQTGGGGGGSAPAAVADIFFGSFESRPGVASAGTLWIEESRAGVMWPTPNPVYYSDGSGWIQVATTVFTGDSGSGGSTGAVPAPGAGDAAAHKVLSAAGGWIAASQVHGFTATLVPSTGPLFYFPASAFAGIIQGWNVVSATGAAVTGSVIIWKKASPGVPTYANAICTALTITGATDLESTDLSAFSTTTIAVGDILAFVLSAATGPVTFMLYYE